MAGLSVCRYDEELANVRWRTE